MLIADFPICDLYSTMNTMNRLIIILLISLLAACKTQHGNPHVLISTAAGEIELELFPKQAPKTVTAFLSYVDSGVYKRSSFYRVLNDDNQPSNAPKSNLIQGGIWRTKPQQLSILPGIPHETTQQTKLSHTSGTISLARTTPGSATTEFFICIGDQPGLDFGGVNNPDGQGYAAFGKVVKGMEVVKAIHKKPEDDQYFHPRVDIVNIERL